MLILEVLRWFRFESFWTAQQLIPREHLLPHDDDKITVNLINIVSPQPSKIQIYTHS